MVPSMMHHVHQVEVQEKIRMESGMLLILEYVIPLQAMEDAFLC